MKRLRFVFPLLVLPLAAPLPVRALDSLVVFSERPRALQLYTRDDNDSAVVVFSGTVVQTGHDSIGVTVLKDGVRQERQAAALSYAADTAVFSLAPKIHAELSEYGFEVELVTGTTLTPVITVDSVVCGDAYILTGQSNSHYVWADADMQNEYWRTFGVKTGNSNYEQYLAGDTLWAWSQATTWEGPNVGVLGLYIQKFISEQHQIPTCLINGGTGGSMISEHLPSAANRMDLKTIYGKVLYRVQKGDLGRIRAILWHQGENDSDPANTPFYRERFRQLHEAWEADFAPEKVYVFQLRPGGGGGTLGMFREIQRTLPDSLGSQDIVLMSTNGLPGYDGLHYSHGGYRAMADWINPLLAVDFYGSLDTVDIHPPNISGAAYDAASQEVQLAFANTDSLVWPEDTLGQRLEDYFYLDGDWGLVDSAVVAGDSIRLQLTGPHFFDHIIYLPDKEYNTITPTYAGPWLRNGRGVTALSFYRVPIDNPAKTVKVVVPNGGEIWPPNTEQTIEWVQTGVSTVNITYSDDGGVTWQAIALGITASQGSYAWTTPEIISASCRVRITDAADSVTADESNGVFGIYTKAITVLAPNGGETWEVGTSQTVAWISSFVDQVLIQYTTDGGTSWGTVARSVNAADGQRTWVIPDAVSTDCRIQIKDMIDPTVVDTSDGPFAIVAPLRTEDDPPILPLELALMQNHPNPFNPATVIEYSLPEQGQVEVVVYDLNGKETCRLVDSEQTAGRYIVRWEGRDMDGRSVPAGIYLCRLQAGGQIKTRKMMLLR
ncbi:MAG: T9SS type A sorting domain-containing protein [Fidelibacterota bacterium]|nr:MAG: T9SS type A sorting domain-containing protein [Candidatus Neomarinimicrobiota bacterium]